MAKEEWKWSTYMMMMMMMIRKTGRGKRKEVKKRLQAREGIGGGGQILQGLRGSGRRMRGGIKSEKSGNAKQWEGENKWSEDEHGDVCKGASQRLIRVRGRLECW